MPAGMRSIISTSTEQPALFLLLSILGVQEIPFLGSRKNSSLDSQVSHRLINTYCREVTVLLAILNPTDLNLRPRPCPPYSLFLCWKGALISQLTNIIRCLTSLVLSHFVPILFRCSPCILASLAEFRVWISFCKNQNVIELRLRH